MYESTPCWCNQPARYIQPSLAARTHPMSDGMPGEFVCTEHVTKDGFEVIHDGERFTANFRWLRWMNGDCHLFAQALHQLTGWDMVAVVHELDPDHWTHILVVTPDGTLLDVLGEHDIDQVCEGYDDDGDSADIRAFPFPGWATRVKPGHPSHLVDDETMQAAAHRLLATLGVLA